MLVSPVPKKETMISFVNDMAVIVIAKHPEDMKAYMKGSHSRLATIAITKLLEGWQTQKFMWRRISYHVS